MHRLQSSSTIVRFRLTALLIGFTASIAPVAAGLILYSVAIHDRDLTLAGLALGGLALLTGIVQRILAARARCPLCLVPSMVRRNCSKHRTARRLLGSHRLRVATSILFRGHFRCPYCGEPTAMEARK
jgi:hypothetical protein